MKNKYTRKEEKEYLKELHEKYTSLVWFARVNPENLINSVVKTNYDEIKNKYPNEIGELQSVNSDWNHGFNSGMLSCLRLLGLGNGITLDNIEEFPNLDT